MESESKLSIISFRETLTERQAQYLDGYLETKSAKKTAVLLGVSSGQASDILGLIAGKRGLRRIRDLLPESDRRVATQDKASPGELYRLLETQEFRCALSGVELVPQSTQLDHISPVSNGGSHQISNLQWVESDVNKAKGTMSNEAFVAMCRRVAAWNA